MNYTLITLTSVVGKVLETLIKEWIDNLLNNFKLIEGRSCLTHLLEFYEVVSHCMDEGSEVGGVYLDIQKAFDKVPQRRLLAKVRTCVGLTLWPM